MEGRVYFLSNGLHILKQKRTQNSLLDVKLGLDPGIAMLSNSLDILNVSASH